MGLRCVEAVAKHILQNVWENNLIPDIAGVDYFAGHQGRTNLQPLDRLPGFVDDFYVYGPLRENEIVRVLGRKPACTTGEEGSGKRVVSQISLFVRQVWGCEDGFKNVSIAHIVYANSRSSRIIETVEKIEKETGYRASYKNCPIFHAKIVGEEGGEVLFSPLLCYTKVGPTILAARKRPCEEASRCFATTGQVIQVRTDQPGKCSKCAPTFLVRTQFFQNNTIENAKKERSLSGRNPRNRFPACSGKCRLYSSEEAEEDRGLAAVLSAVELLQEKMDLLLHRYNTRCTF